MTFGLATFPHTHGPKCPATVTHLAPDISIRAVYVSVRAFEGLGLLELL